MDLIIRHATLPDGRRDIDIVTRALINPGRMA